MFLMELPFFQKCCATHPKMQATLKYFEGVWLRAALYAVFALILWLSLTNTVTAGFVVSALCVSLTSAFYALAGFKHQERENTFVSANATTVSNFV